MKLYKKNPVANKIQRFMYGFKHINDPTDFKKSESYVLRF